MPRYKVEVPQTHILTVEVEAKSEFSATVIVSDMITKNQLTKENSSIRYESTSPSREWKVKRVVENLFAVVIDILYNL